MNRQTLCIAADHPALAGHFPGHPIVPGAVLLDAALHAIEAAATQHSAGNGEATWHIALVKFHRAVAPAEALELAFDATADGEVHFKLCAGAHRVASGTLKRQLAVSLAAPTSADPPL